MPKAKTAAQKRSQAKFRAVMKKYRAYKRKHPESSMKPGTFVKATYAGNMPK